MSNCNYRAPNGEPSLLYTTLQMKYGDQKAEQLWYETRSEQFKNRFQDQDIPRDANGEPGADWVSSVLVNATLPGASDPQQPRIEVTADRFAKDVTSESQMSTRIKQFYDTAAKNPQQIYVAPFKR